MHQVLQTSLTFDFQAKAEQAIEYAKKILQLVDDIIYAN
jgi:hypothetical protein